MRMKETIHSLDSSKFPNTSSDGKTAKIFPSGRQAVAEGRRKAALLTRFPTAVKRLISVKPFSLKHSGR